MFPNPYPKEPTHEEADYLDGEIFDREMQIHVTKSHFGDIIVVAANTGRKIWPNLYYHDNEWHCTMFPQCNSTRGWRTRFDGGARGSREPRFVVTLYYEANPSERCDHGIYEVNDGWALVAQREIDQSGKMVMTERFFSAPYLGPEGMLVDDGLQAIHAVLYAAYLGESQHPRWAPLPELNIDNIPDDVVVRLRWGTQHVVEAFSQGPIVKLRRERM